MGSLEQETSESGLDPCILADGDIDDDGKPRRTGTLWTATAHIITTVIGSGVLSLAWSMAQLGWIAGTATLFACCLIAYYTSCLLADCYRHPDPVTGNRNYSYMEAVSSYLGPRMFKFCGIVQIIFLIGGALGFIITSAISIVAIQKSHCLHEGDHETACKFSTDPYMVGVGVVQIFLSQIPNFHELSWLSYIATITAFFYASIGLGLAIAKVASGQGGRTSLTGVEIGMGLTVADKLWRIFQAIGNVALACVYSPVLIDIQDTLKSSPSENKVMKRANTLGMITAATFYMMCGTFGYAAFGNNAPGNMLSGSGFDKPIWLIDAANVCIVVHLVGAFQVLVHPVFSACESWVSRRWSQSKFVNTEYPIRIGKKKSKFSINYFRITWRTTMVAIMTLIAMLFPFFNEMLALLGAIAYWPMTVYFPVQMHIVQRKIKWGSIKRLLLEFLNLACFVVSLCAAAGAIQGLSKGIQTYKPFRFKE